jgi:hypothetical protein
MSLRQISQNVFRKTGATTLGKMTLIITTLSLIATVRFNNTQHYIILIVTF